MTTRLSRRHQKLAAKKVKELHILRKAAPSDDSKLPTKHSIIDFIAEAEKLAKRLWFWVRLLSHLQ